ncbi:hypothetical protein BCR44DRAFT_1451902 [Catenaria anguillulae PL171]|uniref:Uncharacterized protein n=1 Tax=Catenaria anguillulae PL171 TaxID=765915 RepID=A0A1Y2H6L6_9FUNG|nr:hypothetical protein BCR44DRAFT_1451902 [Catenaria anguillulae PL171]
MTRPAQLPLACLGSLPIPGPPTPASPRAARKPHLLQDCAHVPRLAIWKHQLLSFQLSFHFAFSLTWLCPRFSLLIVSTTSPANPAIRAVERTQRFLTSEYFVNPFSSLHDALYNPINSCLPCCTLRFSFTSPLAPLAAFFQPCTATLQPPSLCCQSALEATHYNGRQRCLHVAHYRVPHHV